MTRAIRQSARSIGPAARGIRAAPVQRIGRRLGTAAHAALALASLAFAPATDPAPPRLDDGSRFTPSAPAPRIASDDQRPIYVVGGIAVLAAVFWWNRRQRDRFEAEEGPTPPRARRRRDRDAGDLRGAARDDDADNLHAAARGDRQAPADDAPDVPSAPARIAGSDRTPAARGPDSKPSPIESGPDAGPDKMPDP